AAALAVRTHGSGCVELAGLDDPLPPVRVVPQQFQVRPASLSQSRRAGFVSGATLAPRQVDLTRFRSLDRCPVIRAEILSDGRRSSHGPGCLCGVAVLARAVTRLTA